MKTSPIVAHAHRRIRLELETVRSFEASNTAGDAVAAKTARCPSYGKRC